MLDDLDRRLLEHLQLDASLTNQDLASRVHCSPPTCLRRVRRLREAGYITRIVAQVNPAAIGLSLTAVVEVTLDSQNEENLLRFEGQAGREAAIQQLHRVSTGPDFVGLLTVADMRAYHALAHRLFTAANKVRNVRTFFSVKCSKFETALPISSTDLAPGRGVGD